jgi:hypothetical protein
MNDESPRSYITIRKYRDDGTSITVLTREINEEELKSVLDYFRYRGCA